MANDSDYLALGIRPDDIGLDKSDLRDKAKFVDSIKQVSGGKLGTKQLTTALSSLTESLIQRVETTTQGVVRAIIPDIESEIFRIEDLIKSNKEGDDAKAMEVIKNLQEKAGISLKNFSRDLNTSITKLEKILQSKQEKKQKEEEDKKDQFSQLEQKQQILKEQGVNTVIDRETLKLKILSNKDIYLEQKAIQQKEIDIQRLKERFSQEEKQILRQETVTQKQSDQITMKRLLIQKQEDKLLVRKAALDKGIGPAASSQRGPIGEMLGGIGSTMRQGLTAPKELFNYFRLMGSEILGFLPGFGLLKRGFKGLGGMLGGFGKSIGKSTMMLGRMAIAGLMASAKYILIGVAIAAVVAGLYAAYQWVKKKFSFGTDDGKERPGQKWYETDGQYDKKQAKLSGDKAALASQEDGRAGLETTMSQEDGKGGDGYKVLPITKDMQAGAGEYTDYPQSMRMKSAQEGLPNLNQMSTDMMAKKEKGQGGNAVVAPTTVNNSTNNNSGVSMPMDVNNIDRSFINIGSSVAI